MLAFGAWVACRTVSFLWGVAKSKAEAVASGERLSQRTAYSGLPNRNRCVIVFVLGGVAPAELQAFAAAHKCMQQHEADTRDPDLFIGSTCIATPFRLASELFSDVIKSLQDGLASQLAS